MWKQDIVYLKQHLTSFERLLTEEKKRINEEVPEFPLDKYSDEQQHEISADFALDEISVDQDLAPFHYQAIFLIIYAWFEHWIKINFFVKENKDKGYLSKFKYWIKRNKKDSFFKKLKITLKSKNKGNILRSDDWSMIQTIAKIRNLISHNGTLLELNSKGRKELEKFVDENPDKIEFTGAVYDFGKEGERYPREIKVNKFFCKYVLLTLESFLSKIYTLSESEK